MSRLDLAKDLAPGKQVKINDGPFKGMTGRVSKYDLEKKKVELLNLRYEKCMKSRVFSESDYLVKENYLRIDSLIKDLERIINLKMKDYKLKTVEKITKLDSMSPLKTLTRGYSVVECDNSLVRSIKDVKKDDLINVRLSDGIIDAKVI